jgi:hypothetical protein
MAWLMGGICALQSDGEREEVMEKMIPVQVRFSRDIMTREALEFKQVEVIQLILRQRRCFHG